MRYKWLTQPLASTLLCSLLLTQPALAMDAQYRSLSQEERQTIYQEKALTPEDATFLNLIPFSMNDQPEAFAGDELPWKNAFDVGTVALAGLFAVGTVYNLLTDEAAEAGYTSYLLVPLLYVGGRLIGNYHTTAYRELNNKALQKDLGLSKSQISWKWSF